MRLAERLGVDAETAQQTYYACLLFYVGCTADAEVAADLFDESALVTHLGPAMFGSQREAALATLRALVPPEGAAPARALGAARKLPRAVGAYRASPRGGLRGRPDADRPARPAARRPGSVRRLHRALGRQGRARASRGARRSRSPCASSTSPATPRSSAWSPGPSAPRGSCAAAAGHAFDPAIATCLADDVGEIFAGSAEGSAWDRVLAAEPAPELILEGEAIDRALAAMGDFADLASPYLVGHSAGVARGRGRGGRACRGQGSTRGRVRRAALVHDLGRVAVPLRIWHKPGPLAPDEWERVRLHAYHSERVLARSPFLAALASVATAHHERLDGSGYHRGRRRRRARRCRRACSPPPTPTTR